MAQKTIFCFVNQTNGMQTSAVTLLFRGLRTAVSIRLPAESTMYFELR